MLEFEGEESRGRGEYGTILEFFTKIYMEEMGPTLRAVSVSAVWHPSTDTATQPSAIDGRFLETVNIPLVFTASFM